MLSLWTTTKPGPMIHTWKFQESNLPCGHSRSIAYKHCLWSGTAEDCLNHFISGSADREFHELSVLGIFRFCSAKALALGRHLCVGESDTAQPPKQAQKRGLNPHGYGWSWRKKSLWVATRGRKVRIPYF